MNNFERVNNLFKDSFISEVRNLIYIDIVILLYPFSLIMKSMLMKISNTELLVLLLLNIILILLSILVKRTIMQRNRFNYSLYIKIYNSNNPKETIQKYIHKSISNFSYKGMTVFHLSIYIQMYILSLIINGNINFNIITMIFSIFGTTIVLYPTAIASITDWRKNRINLLNSMEDI